LIDGGVVADGGVLRGEAKGGRGCSNGKAGGGESGTSVRQTAKGKQRHRDVKSFRKIWGGRVWGGSTTLPATKHSTHKDKRAT